MYAKSVLKTRIIFADSQLCFTPKRQFHEIGVHRNVRLCKVFFVKSVKMAKQLLKTFKQHHNIYN